MTPVRKSLDKEHIKIQQSLVRELGVHPKYRNSNRRVPKSMWKDWEIYYKKRLDEELFKLARKAE